ncbi:MAG: radical SAM family heme chaperone HemW [Alphaproteobacteria bacterium]|nr:radical SAM family heme chaperone HemW [Alphaproteobacteria bacterium]
MNKPHNIYIHVPFCIKKCNYCAFYSRACPEPDWDSYAAKIIDELKIFGQILGRVPVPTIFFGGGTPSLMPEKIFAKILNEIHANFDITHDAEITLEANPGTLPISKLDEFCNIGMNRLSVGVQSLDDKKLQFLGRIHNAHDATMLLESAINRGIRVSADFIYGLPGDSVSDVIKTCCQINDMGISHCSMYELTIEPNTPFGQMQMDMPTNEVMAEMYMAIGQNLNLPRYEVSNYAAPGNECRHNQNVWDGDAYIGIGEGAAGRIFVNDTWYEQLGGGKLFEKMTNETRAMERIITGMRTMRGVLLDEWVKKIINIEFAKSHSDMLGFNGNRLFATDKGIIVLDDLITKLVK